MSILLGLILALQVATVAYLVYRFELNEAEVETPEPVVVNNTTFDYDYVDSALDELRGAMNELSEHVDGVVDIVTSLVEQADKNTEDTARLTDRVSRLAYTASETKNQLKETIDKIGFAPEPVPVYAPPTPAEMAQPETFQRPYVPPQPQPPLPQQPIPQPPVVPVAPEPAPQPVIPPAAPEVEPPVDQVPLVAARGPNDPMITDLRAVPFMDHPDAVGNIHELPLSGDYEIMNIGGPMSRRSSRTNGLRQRFR